MLITRFSPSPTGSLHFGSIRTALFSWLYAKQKKGKFILRIEDTDLQRSNNYFSNLILDVMNWLKISYDAGPFFQQSRKKYYQMYIQKLLKSGYAYKCYCSKERLAKLREMQILKKQNPKYDGYCRNKNIKNSNFYIIRFKNPKNGRVIWYDLIKGKIEISNSELDDLILSRSDGSYTYNFAAAVDDHLMKITHVIRGDDHVSNTPKQINILQAIDGFIPKYAHIPMILDKNGKRLSKRHNTTDIIEYRNLGYLPQSLLNYLIRLGWSHKNKEIFSINEMIKYFKLQNVNQSASIFDINKLRWLNRYYINSLSYEDIKEEIKRHFLNANIDIHNGPKLKNVFLLMSKGTTTLVELAKKSKFFYQENIKININLEKKYFSYETHKHIKYLYQKLFSIEKWESLLIFQAIKNTMKKFHLNIKNIAMPMRIIITGFDNSPSISHIAELLGKYRCLSRIQNFLSMN